MPTFTEDISTPAHRFFTHWLTPYKNIKANFLEVGAYQGMTSLHLLETYLLHPESTLDIVDSGSDNENNILLFDNLKDHIFNKKVRLYNMFFHDAYRVLENESYDFIYVDACHKHYHTLEDMVLSFQLLKVGGIMIVDDCNNFFLDTVKNVCRILDAYTGFLECQFFHQVCIITKIKGADLRGNK